jgi:catechol-2,3-dioxygenase
MKKLILLLVVVLFSKLTVGQEKEGFSMSFDHLALSVDDVEKSAEFYKTILNLDEITNKTKGEDIRWFSLDNGKELHLISIAEGKITLNKAFILL